MGSLKSLKTKTHKFLDLNNTEKLVFVKYSLLYPFFLILFRSIGYKNVKNSIDYLIRSKTDSVMDKPLSAADKISNMVNIAAANCFIGSTCLERSLFTYFILGLNGIKSDLKIGVDNNEYAFKAHAWVEKEGTVLKGSKNPVNKYSAF